MLIQSAWNPHRHQLLVRPAMALMITAMLLQAAVPDQPADGEDRQPLPGRLQPFNSVVGSWRGVGQPKRGSRRGAWQEKTVCRWDFSGDQTTVRFDASEGKQFQRLTLTAGPDPDQLILTEHHEAGSRVYRGTMPDEWPARIQLLTDADDRGARSRCTLEQLSNIRFVMLFERQSSATGSFRRIAGIGYTRSGHRLAENDGNQVECVVTGGQGTIAVTHQGKTWYVCCEGCRQAFEDAPDEIIAAYLARKD